MSVDLDAGALTTVAAITERLSSLSDDRVKRAINAASLQIQAYLGRDLAYTVVATDSPEQYAGSGTSVLILRRAPIVDVEQVKIDGVLDTEWARDQDYDRRGWLQRVSGWPRQCAVYADLTRDTDSRAAALNVTVAYSAGFVLPNDVAVDGVARLPYDIEEACILQAIALLTRRVGPRDLLEETTPGGWRRKWSMEAPNGPALAPDARSILDNCPFRRVRI